MRNWIKYLITLSVVLGTSGSVFGAFVEFNVADGDWSDSTKWNAGAGPLPGSGDSVRFDYNTTATITSGTTGTAAKVSLGGFSGAGTLIVDAGGTLLTTIDSTIATSRKTGTLDVSGTVSGTGDLLMGGGNTSTGTVLVKSGAVVSMGAIILGNGSSAGTYSVTQTGGAVSLTGDLVIADGDDSASSGTYTISGGSLSAVRLDTGGNGTSTAKFSVDGSDATNISFSGTSYIAGNTELGFILDAAGVSALDMTAGGYTVASTAFLTVDGSAYDVGTVGGGILLIGTDSAPPAFNAANVSLSCGYGLDYRPDGLYVIPDPAHDCLVHHYRLDETFQHEAVADSAGSLDAVSTTELFRGRSGMIAGAMKFSEVDNDHIDFGPSSALVPSGNFTVTAWVKFSTTGFDNNERIMDCSDGDSYAQMTSGFNLKVQNNCLHAFVGDGTSKAATSASSAQLGMNGWYLVALRYKSSSDPGTASDGMVQVTAVPFANTLLDATALPGLTDSESHSAGAVGSSTHLLAGTPTAATPNETLSLDGVLDDVRIYDSELSDQELADLFNENLSVGSCLRWIFNVDGDKEGWSAAGTLSDTVVDGDYVVVSSGNDPIIESPDNLNLDLTGIEKVYVKARNGSDRTSGSVSFQTDATPTFLGNFVDFTITANDPGYTTYEVDMTSHANWSGTLKRLRINLPNGESTGAEIRFDRIAVGESGNRPNVIVMLADDLGWRDVSVNGSDYYQTPNVERLADMGMNFPNAYSANPLCSPTRAGILTGLYPGRVRFNTPAGHEATVTLDPGVSTTASSYLPSTSVRTRTRLPNAYVTYAELMKQVGYSTSFLGKWHLGMDEYVPDNQGFDFVIGGRQHSGPPGSYFAPFSADSNIPADWPDGSPVVADDHVNDILAAWAADFIEDNRNRPFLMNMWWYDVHAPFEAKSDVRASYVGTSGTDGRQNSPTMAAMIEVMDDGIGVVLDKLEELGLTDDTIIFFTGDNGGWMYSWIDEDLAVPTDNYPSRAGKACIWDGGSHVPFIVTWPGSVAGGTVNSNNVNNLDIYATVLDMLDLDPYEGYPLDSTTLVPSLLGQTPANSNLLYNQFPVAPPATGTFPGVWVRRDDMKLIRFFHGNGGTGNHRYELYNIALDPGEENNLADDNPMLVAELDALIEQHLSDTDALVPIANPYYIPPSFDGWIPNHGVWVQDGVGGRIKMVSNSFLPALDSPDLSVLPMPAKVRVQMTSRSYGDGRIWWKFPGDTEWLSGQSVSFNVTHDNVERVIEVAINPGAPVAQIRYQPSEGYFETDVLKIEILDAVDNIIESMSLVDTDGDGMTDADELAVARDPSDAADMAFHYNTENDFEGWAAIVNNISGLVVSNGAMAGTAVTGDPYVGNYSVGFLSAQVPQINVRMRASANASVQLYWAPQGGSFVGNSDTLNYSGSGDWQILEYIMAGNPKWDSKTIDKLRIDPINAAGAWFEIDWIRSSGSGPPPSSPSEEYEIWVALFGLDINSTGAMAFDYESDGLDNLTEYALGGNPTNNDAASVLPVFQPLENYFYYIHHERTDDTSLTYTVELTDDLVNANSNGWETDDVEFVEESALSDVLKAVTNRTPTLGKEQQFIRLKIEQQ